MALAAALVPYPEMCSSAREISRLFPSLPILTIEHVESDTVAARAKELERDGCDIIISRGLHAALIKDATHIPVVEIHVSMQDLGVLVLDIKKRLGKSSPRIALIGFENMMCDTSDFRRLFGVTVDRYMINATSDPYRALVSAVHRAISDGCDAVIGGRTVCREADNLGVCCGFIPGSYESIRTAFEQAKHVAYAVDLEKKNNAEIQTMLDYTFNGILQIDSSGIIQRANASASVILESQGKTLLGDCIRQLLPDLFQEMSQSVFREGEELHFATLFKQQEITVHAAPIFVEDSVQGAILTLHEGRRIMEMSSDLRYEQYLRGSLARWRFDDLPVSSAEGKTVLKKMRRLASLDTPLLLTGEPGSGKGILAQCIHNESPFRKNAFVAVDCLAYSHKQLDELLFGRPDSPDALSMVSLAQNGTLYLSNIDTLSESLQYRLLRLINGSFFHNGTGRPQKSSLRLIVSTRNDLMPLLQERAFREDLYYTLKPVELPVLPLRERKDEILPWVRISLKQWGTRYSRTVHLTKDAESYLLDYSWPGNLSELHNLCKQMVLLSEKRTVNDVLVRRMAESLSPAVDPDSGQIIRYRESGAEKLVELLKKNRGSRQATAEELGISTTTLWRRMKKYGIDRDLTF